MRLGKVADIGAKGSRMVVLNHPANFNILVLRKELMSKQELEIEGVNLLEDDTPYFKFNELGEGVLLFLENYQSSNVIQHTSPSVSDRNEVLTWALIEPLKEFGFELQKTDLIYISFSENLAICYEIVEIEMPNNIPSALNSFKYGLNKRDDLDYILE